MEVKQEKALHFYEKHLQRLRQYNETHKDAIRDNVKKSYYKMKEDPERWETFKAKKREYYLEKKKTKEQKE